MTHKGLLEPDWTPEEEAAWTPGTMYDPDDPTTNPAFVRFKVKAVIPCGVCGAWCEDKVCDDCKGEPDEAVTAKTPEVDETRCVHGWKLKLFCPDCPGERACR